jgi:hypothetical protein
MELALVVVRAFGSHRIGDTIDQEKAIRQVLDGEQANCVVHVTRPAVAAKES